MLVKGFPNYEVNENGEVWSRITNRFLKPHVSSKDGYLRVVLRKDGRSYSRTIHRIVAETFLPNSDVLPCINHIDENKRNNHLSNLEWCTHQENMNHGTAIKRARDNTDYQSIALKNSKRVKQIDNTGKVIRVWASANECMRITGFDNSSIAKCCRGIMEQAYGFRWRYG
jgi:hypothetical protein